MITLDSMMSISKGEIEEASKKLEKDDIPRLIEWLSLKDDAIRYQAFLLLQSRSGLYDDVYPYWELCKDKLKSKNSYQRSIGLMLLAENARWDTENRMEDAVEECLRLLTDEKPITVRKCIESLGKIAEAKPGLRQKIASALISLDLTAVKETMRKSILLDILAVLFAIRRGHKADDTEGFILNALSGALLDKKSKKQLEALL